MTPSPSQPLGLFDSGLGGLTVMNQLMRVLPNERMVYFGDNARSPYGNKSKELLLQYSIENTQWLIQQNIKLLIVACNTVSSLGLNHLNELKECASIPILGMIEPGVEKVVECSKNQRIAILGTKSTIQSEAYQKAIKQRLPQAELFPIACPLFVPLIEEGWGSHPVTQMVVKEYLAPLKHQNIDTILLGCTHYPILKKWINLEMGEEVVLIDSAEACAVTVRELLNERKQLSHRLEGTHQYFTSDCPLTFQKHAEVYFEKKIAHVQRQVHQGYLA